MAKSNMVTKAFIRSPVELDDLHNCECKVKVNTGTIDVSFFSLHLGMDGKKCRDWVLLESNDGKMKHTDLSCGNVNKGEKNVTTLGQTLLIHFHQAASKKMNSMNSMNTEAMQKKMEGFWAQLRGKYKVT